MKHARWTFLYCEWKREEVFKVVWKKSWEYKLRFLSDYSIHTFPESFVEEKFEKIEASILKRLYINFISFFIIMKNIDFKKISWGIFEYIFITFFLYIPVLFFILWLDFAANLQVDLFDWDSFWMLRIIFFLWIFIVNIAFIKNKWWEELKNIL